MFPLRSASLYCTAGFLFCVCYTSLSPAVVEAGRQTTRAAASATYRQRQTDNRRVLGINNNSGKNLVVEWIDPKTGNIITLQPSFAPGSSTTFNSFVNHTFAVHEAAGACDGDHQNGGHNHGAEECNVRFITVDDDSEIDIDRDLHISTHQYAAEGTPTHNAILDDEYESGLDASSSRKDDTLLQYHTSSTNYGLTMNSDFTASCKQLAMNAIASGVDETKVFEELAHCLENEATLMFQKANDEIAFEEKVRLDLSKNIENITCADPNKELSTPIDVRTWTHGNEPTRTVNIMHDRQHSQIHVLEDFVTQEECDAITAAAKPKLHRGTVADGKGGHKLSEHRKAWQAGIRIPFEKEKDDNPIVRVFRRIYNYTNHAVGYNLTVDGQEDIMSIQYFGNGQNSTEAPDQYMPHCDGACDGLPHKTGGRVATMVMYCNVPELGGATNFQNAGVFVKPKLHAAAFFSYMDPVTHKMEPGFTSHSGCPVIEGTKRIAVHWMRIGVDKKNPWDSFNTLTIKKDDDEDC